MCKHIEELLSKRGLGVAGVEQFIYTLGPGSFTGLRVINAFIRALHLVYGTDKKFVPLNLFEVYLKNAAKSKLILKISRAQGFVMGLDPNGQFICRDYKLKELISLLFKETLNSQVYLLGEWDEAYEDKQFVSLDLKKINLNDFYLKISHFIYESSFETKARDAILDPLYAKKSSAEENLKI